MPGISVPLGGAFLGVAGSPDPTPGSELGRGDRLREGGRISSKKDDVDTPSTRRKGKPESNLKGIINVTLTIYIVFEISWFGFLHFKRLQCNLRNFTKFQTYLILTFDIAPLCQILT